MFRDHEAWEIMTLQANTNILLQLLLHNNRPCAVEGAV